MVCGKFADLPTSYLDLAASTSQDLYFSGLVGSCA